MAIDKQIDDHLVPTPADVPEITKHPKALYLLFFTEMWERFSFYGMRAMLYIYLVSSIANGGLEWNESKAGQLYGIYTGLVYLTALLGGYLADKALGYRKAIFIGGVLIVIGHFSLAIDSMVTFYLGLLIIVIGNGFFKPNISSMVGQLYPEGSRLKDSAYTIFYMGINVGAFLGAIAIGAIGEKIDWHLGFGTAGVGMILGLIVFYYGQKHLGKIGLKPVKQDSSVKINEEPLTKQEKQKMGVIFVLFLFSVIFWMSFEQQGSSMNLFALNFTDRTIDAFNFEIPATWFQSVNAFFIFILAPLFATLWVKLGNRNPTGPVKFSFGLILLSLGFIALVIGSSGIEPGAKNASVSMGWLFIAYFFHTSGELCLSPVGLSFVNKLSPKKVFGIMFGLWFLGNAIGNYSGGALTGFLETMSWSSYFTMFVIIAASAGILLLLITPFLKKWMHGVK